MASGVDRGDVGILEDTQNDIKIVSGALYSHMQVHLHGTLC